MHKIGLGWLVCGCAAVGITGGAAAKDLASLLDRPLKVTHAALPRDKDNPQAKPELRCSYYAGFMVKEIDLGEEGAARLSIVRGRDPVCVEKRAANEKIVPPDSWTGYFRGAYGDYIFFDAEDGWNGGLGFAVFTPDARKLFDDVAERWTRVSFVAVPGPAGISSGLELHYARVYGAKCSLAGAEADSCWRKIRRDTGLHGPAPDCKADYAREQKRTPRSAVLDDPTAVEYDAATLLAGSGTRVTAVTGVPPRCQPQD